MEVRITTLSENTANIGYEDVAPNTFVKREGKLFPNPLADDLALIIETEPGLIVILGCAHRGIITTLPHAQKLTGREIIHTVVGGAHLFRAPEIQLQKTIIALREMAISKLGVSHCSGFYASVCLAQEFGDIFFLNNAGTRFTLC